MTNLRAIVVALCVGWLASPALAETRLALVITNQAYSDDIGRLANSHRDGALIVDALKSVGFEAANIAVVKDADQPAMRLALADFVERLEKAGPDAVAFFYFSGHGAADRTERGENYLIPVGARITVAKQLPILGVGLSEIAKTLERVPAKARFIVVDACRNVAFTKGLKDAAKGFVPERKLDGMIVAFATRPGDTADDNNVYAAALASILPTPGLRAEEVFKETQLKVAELSKGNQVPWTEDGLLTRFRFKELSAATPINGNDQSTQANPLTQVQPKVAESFAFQRTSLWRLIRQDYPDWYATRVREALSLRSSAIGKDDDDPINKYLIEQLVSLRRSHAKEVLASSPARLLALAQIFHDNLAAFGSKSAEVCFGFISAGESSPLVIDALKSLEIAERVNRQFESLLVAAADGRQASLAHGPAQRADYDMLTAALTKKGWTMAELQLFSDPKALARAKPEQVCRLVKDWFEAQIALPDEAIRVRLLVESLRPVVAG